MQALLLLHGVMGLIGMGHLQVREGKQRATVKERREGKKGEGLSERDTEREGESVKGGRKGGSEMSSSVNNMEQAF